MCVDLEVLADKQAVLAKYSESNDVEDALAQCGMLFYLCFPNKDFDLIHLPMTDRECDLLKQYGYIGMSVCDEKKLAPYVRSSIWGKVKGKRGWVYDDYGAHRRDYLFRFEFQQRAFQR